MTDKPQCQVCRGTGKVYVLRRDGRVDRTDWRLDCPLCLKLAHTAALAAARREGAEEMRERAARYVDHCRAVVPGIGPVVDAIRALPLPAPHEGGEP